MAAITVPARASPVANETADSPASKITSGLRRILSSRINQPCWRSCATSFRPTVRARSSASPCVSPLRWSAAILVVRRPLFARRQSPLAKHEYSGLLASRRSSADLPAAFCPLPLPCLLWLKYPPRYPALRCRVVFAHRHGKCSLACCVRIDARSEVLLTTTSRLFGEHHCDPKVIASFSGAE